MARTPEDRVHDLIAERNAAEADRDRLREALEKLANPTHQPKGEEANLLQMEVQQIAREALSRPENERG